MKKAQTLIIVIIILVLIAIAGYFVLNTGFGQKKQTSEGPKTESQQTQEEKQIVGDITGEVVKITSSGFSPNTLTIYQGMKVEFINEDSNPHWPASAVHPTHKVYPENTGKCALIGGSDFDACKGLNNGESYIFTFNEKGNWKYHDHLDPKLLGEIVVE